MKTTINVTNQDYTNLGFVVDKAQAVLKQCGIKMVDGITYDFHTTKAFGYAMPSKKKITINYFFYKACIKENQIHLLENTMIHEMLHIVAEQIQRGCGHTGMWKTLAWTVSNKTEYKIQRLGSAEKAQVKLTEKPAKFIVKCEDCGKEYYYQRETNTIKMIRRGVSNARCGVCKSNRLVVV